MARTKGARNKTNLALKRATAEVAILAPKRIRHVFEGNSLALLMMVYKDPKRPIALRVDCAKAALPYEAHRLNPVDWQPGQIIEGEAKRIIHDLSDESIAKIMKLVE